MHCLWAVLRTFLQQQYFLKTRQTKLVHLLLHKVADVSGGFYKPVKPRPPTAIAAAFVVNKHVSSQILQNWIFSYKLHFKMVKLTPELIQQSVQRMNPVKDRELILRGKSNESQIYEFDKSVLFVPQDTKFRS